MTSQRYSHPLRQHSTTSDLVCHSLVLQETTVSSLTSRSGCSSSTCSQEDSSSSRSSYSSIRLLIRESLKKPRRFRADLISKDIIFRLHKAKDRSSYTLLSLPFSGGPGMQQERMPCLICRHARYVRSCADTVHSLSEYRS